MIQRIQSLLLFLVTVFSILLLQGNILRFTDINGASFLVGFKGVSRIVADGSITQFENGIPLNVVIILISVISVISILCFRKRKIQMKLTMGLILLSVILIGLLLYYSMILVNRYEATIVAGVKMFLPVLINVFALMAYRKIKRDEELVKSLDRLR